MIEILIYETNGADNVLFFCLPFNPSRPSPRRREKINLNFYFHFFVMPQIVL